MKFGGLWKLRGLRAETPVAAAASSRRTAMSDWLNDVIRPADGEGGKPAQPADPDRGTEDRQRQDSLADDRAPRRGAEEPPRRRVGFFHRQGRRNANTEVRESTRARGLREAARARLNRLSDRFTRPPRVAMAAPAAAAPPRRLLQALGELRGAILPSLNGAPRPRQHGEPVAGVSGPDWSIEQAVAEIKARQRVLDDQKAESNAAADDGSPSFLPPLSPVWNEDRSAETAPPPAESSQSERAQAEQIERARRPGLESQNSEATPRREGAPSQNPETATLHSQSVRRPLEDAPEQPAIDLGSLQRQLRELTARIEELRPIGDLEMAIAGLRTDLAQILHSLTQAPPQHAIAALESEVKILAQRLEHSRRCGIDAAGLANLEQGLADLRQTLRGFATAESLAGVEETVKELARKVDVITAKDDPAVMQQLETAVSGLRGIVSHVASNDALARVAAEIQSLSAKVDGLANSAPAGPSLSALANRIDLLADALNASTEAGQTIPRELEKLLSGLIDKLEWVQLTHTDHAALAHLEDRIATLVKRFDASDARLVHVEAVERGLADLLVHIEQMRGNGGKGEVGTDSGAVAGGAIEHDFAEIRQAERRTQDSLEAIQGTVEHVVDRLAMIESDMRIEKATGAPAASPAVATATADTTPRAAAARLPIDPNLPPDHPLEPRAGGARMRESSPAERIAASEAALASKPPVIPDPGGRPDFIAAARRAAQAAAASLPAQRTSVGADTASAAVGVAPKNLTQRLRMWIVGAATALILVGGYSTATRLLRGGGTVNPAPKMQTGQSSPTAAPAVGAASVNLTLSMPAPGLVPSAGTKSPSNPLAEAATATAPEQQSLLDDAAPHDTGRASPPAVDPSPSGGTAGGSGPGSPLDITGTLPPRSAAPSDTNAPGSGEAAADKLPDTIGSPALRSAALAGDAAAAYEVAMRFAEGRGVEPDNESALHWLNRAAQAGFAPAEFRLGGMYEKGLGVTKDLAKARDFYLAAAAKGHGKAMHNLAVLYAEGIDGPADYRSAAAWFRKAADRGVADSQYNLGILYARGIGVERNFSESFKWFSLAANQGDADAVKKRDEIAAHLDPQSLAAARLAVQRWKAEPQPADATIDAAPSPAAAVRAAPAAKPKAHAAGARPPAADAAKTD